MDKQPIPTIEELMARLEGLSKQVDVLARDNESLSLENSRLASDIASSKHASDVKLVEIESDYKNQVAYWKAERDKLIEQIKLMNTRFYGSKSEKVIPEQLGLFNDTEACADGLDEPSVDEVIASVLSRRRGGKRTFNFEDMEMLVIDHVLAEEKRECFTCGNTTEDMKVEVTRVVKLVPAHLVVEEHRRHVYICTACSKQNAKDGSIPSTIMRADMPSLPIPGSFASPSLIAYVINAKYANALPLYRLEEDFCTIGAAISRQNMANWILNVHERWLSLVHIRMKERLLQHDIIHADETSVQVLKEPNREAKSKSYMWLFRTAQVDVPICIYQYHPTRATSVPLSFFANWSGTIMTDGYEPYFKLGPGITNTACLVHVRRRFAEIVKVAGGDTKAASVESVALAARRRIDEMFAIDSKFDVLTPTERKAARLDKLAPRMKQFKQWAHHQIGLAVPKMALHKALAYAQKMWPYVENVLDDGRLELSNNIAERAIKPFVIGRKNWLFSDTPRGAHASAAIYSIVITAKLNGLNPRKYVEWLLSEMPNTKDLANNATLERFMPWSDFVPTDCKLSPKKAAEAAEMRDEPIMSIDPTTFDED